MGTDNYSSSVVLSTYNGSQFIVEQLDSIRKQTVMPDEVIICDDKSKDDTAEIIKKYIVDHELKNWKLIVNETNKGWKRNFIELVAEANADIIFLCDQDDVWDKNKIKYMCKAMKNDSIDVLVSYIHEFSDNNYERDWPSGGDGQVHKIDLTKNFMNVRFPGCAYCIRKSFVNRIIKYWSETIPHDALFWRMAMFSDSLYELEIPLLYQRKHSDSTFAIEARNNRTLVEKINELNYTSDVISSIKSMLEANDIMTLQKSIVLQEAETWNKLRNKLFTGKNIVDWIKLIRYLNFYQTKKRYLLDLILVIKG